MSLSKAFWPVTIKYAGVDVVIVVLLYLAYAAFEKFAKIFQIDGWAGHMMHFMHSLGVSVAIVVFAVLLMFNVLEYKNTHSTGETLFGYFLGKISFLVIDTIWGFFLWFAFWFVQMLKISVPVEGEGLIVLALDYGYGAIINLIYAIIPLKFLLHLYKDYRKSSHKQEETPYGKVIC